MQVDHADNNDVHCLQFTDDSIKKSQISTKLPIVVVVTDRGICSDSEGCEAKLVESPWKLERMPKVDSRKSSTNEVNLAA